MLSKVDCKSVYTVHQHILLTFFHYIVLYSYSITRKFLVFTLSTFPPQGIEQLQFRIENLTLYSLNGWRRILEKACLVHVIIHRNLIRFTLNIKNEKKNRHLVGNTSLINSHGTGPMPKLMEKNRAHHSARGIIDGNEPQKAYALNDRMHIVQLDIETSDRALFPTSRIRKMHTSAPRPWNAVANTWKCCHLTCGYNSLNNKTKTISSQVKIIIISDGTNAIQYSNLFYRRRINKTRLVLYCRPAASMMIYNDIANVYGKKKHYSSTKWYSGHAVDCESHNHRFIA